MIVLSWKALGRGAVAAVVVLLLASFASTLHSVEAQPPVPPLRAYGSVTLDGATAPAGTVVSAQIGGVECGSATVVVGDPAYTLDVVSSAEITGCGSAAASVTFSVGGVVADQTATWDSAFLALDLTATTAAPTAVPPTVAPPTVAPPTEVPPEIVVTPFGSGGDLGGGSGTAWWALAAGAGVLALAGLAGWMAYRRTVR